MLRSTRLLTALPWALIVASPVSADATSFPTARIAGLVCEPTLFSGTPSTVVKLVMAHLNVDVRSHEGAFEWSGPPSSPIGSGSIEFQSARELYGPSATSSPRLKLLQISVRASGGDRQSLGMAINHCTKRRSTVADGMTTWVLPGRHLLTIDDDGNGMAEVTASVDQSDIAE